MDLKEQLRASILAMKDGKYEGAKELFEKLDKEEISRTEDTTTAYDWVVRLSRVLAAAVDNETKRTDLCAAFERKESEDSEQFIALWLNKTDRLLEKIALIKNRLEEQDEKKVDALIYKPEYRADSSTLKDYEDIGTYLTSETSVVIKEMTELTYATYEKSIENPENTPPSFIVCSSSGTGKTQLPFSLGIPLLYFFCIKSDEVTVTQPIYKVYKEISIYFMKLLEDDFSTFTNALKKYINKTYEAEISKRDKHLEGIARYSLNYFTVDYVKKVPCEYRSISFLIQLIEKIRAIEEENKKKSKESDKKYSPPIWPKLQLSLKKRDEIFPNEQSIKESKEKLYEMYFGKPATGSEMESKKFKRDPKFNLPLIFLDEFNVNSDTRPKSRAMYAFYRNIIRACDLIPVLMGTNSQITNVITAGTQSGDKPYIWAHIFYRLPKYPWELYEKNVNNATTPTGSGREILKQLFQILKHERPLFVQSIFEDENRLKELDENSTSIIEWLKYILSKFRSAFSDRKSRYMEEFYSVQAQLFISSYNRTYNYGKPFPSSLIHSYLAYLTRPKNIYRKSYKSCFDIYQIGDKLKYKSMINGAEKSIVYEPSARLPKFEVEPLTCLAFSQNNSENSCSFEKLPPSKDFSEFFTTFQAIMEIKKVLDGGQVNLGVHLDFKGSVLEQIVSTAFMVSSHTKFLEGMEFKEWFESFVQQLACYTSNKFEVPKLIDFDSSFKPGKFKVPYFAFDCARWSKSFIELLPKDHFHLGTYSGAFRESRDLSASTDLYQENAGFNSKRKKSSGNEQDSEEEQYLEEERFSDDEQDSDYEKEVIKISSFVELDPVKANEALDLMENLEQNDTFNDQNIQMKADTSNTQTLPSVSTNPSDQISPKSAKTPGKGSGRMGIFSVECKLHKEDISRWRVKEIIMKMISAGLQSKFNFIVAPKISAQIEFEIDPNFDAKFKQIKKLKNQIESLNSTKTKSTSSKDNTENDFKQELTNEKARLQMELKDKIPYNDISIFRLQQSDTKLPTKTDESECCYTSSESKLQLVRVYNNPDVESKAVFILIDLTEIHGEKHLEDCLKYFKN